MKSAEAGVAGYRLLLAYDGSAYHGWQEQSGTATVGGSFAEALVAATGERPPIRAAGRTDRGVHAHGQVVGFELAREWPPAALMAACNRQLPEDIAVLAVAPAEAGFDPRRRAWRRTYRYLLSCSPVPLPVGRQYVWRVPRRLEIEPMREAARLAVGTHDFGGFGVSPQPGGSTIRTVDRAELACRDGLLTVEIRGDAFLRGMVRNLVGALVAVGEWRVGLPEFGAALARTAAGPVRWRMAPAHGLHQWQVEYRWPGQEVVSA